MSAIGHEGHANVSLFLDGRLPPDERVGFEAHLAGCPDCRTLLESSRLLRGDLKNTPSPELPPAFQIKVLAKALRRREESFAPPWRWIMPVSGFTSLAASMVILLSIHYLWQPGRYPMRPSSATQVMHFSPTTARNAYIEIIGPIAMIPVVQEVRPEYPSWAKAPGIKGTTRLYVTLSQDGSVQHRIQLIESAGYPELDQLAIGAIRQWRFSARHLTPERWGIITFKIAPST